MLFRVLVLSADRFYCTARVNVGRVGYVQVMIAR